MYLIVSFALAAFICGWDSILEIASTTVGWSGRQSPFAYELKKVQKHKRWFFASFIIEIILFSIFLPLQWPEIDYPTAVATPTVISTIFYTGAYKRKRVSLPTTKDRL